MLVAFLRHVWSTESVGVASKHYKDLGPNDCGAPSSKHRKYNAACTSYQLRRKQTVLAFSSLAGSILYTKEIFELYTMEHKSYENLVGFQAENCSSFKF